MIKNIYKSFFVLITIVLLTNSSYAEKKPISFQQAESDYSAGKYKESSEQFQRLYNTLLPQAKTKHQKEDLLKIQYNLARALDKAGEFEKAREVYIVVAGDANNKWALQAKFDLGCLYAQMANKISGTTTDEAEEKTRKEIESLLKNALEQWRSILSVQPDYPEVKEKIERVRTVLIQWKKAWRESDLKKDAEKKQPLEYALEVVKDIIQSREKTIALGKKKDSLKTRQDYYELAESQSDITQKMPLLKNKIDQILSNGNPSDTNKQAQEAINAWINQSGESLEKAAQGLFQRNPATSQKEMEKAAELVDNFYLTAVELVPLVQRAIEEQKKLIENTEKLIQNKNNKEGASDLVWLQQRMQPWTALIAPKAKAQLAQLPPEKPQQKEEGSSLLEKAESLQDAIDALHNPEDKAVPQQGGNPQDEQIQQQRNVCKKAIEIGPTIHPIVQSATENLKENNLENAVKAQKEALKLLEEILKNENQDQQNQDKQNQDKQNQDKQNQDKQNQDKQNQDKQNQDKQNQDKQNQDQQNQDQQNQDKQNQDQQNQDQQNQDQQNQDKQNQDQQNQDKQNQDQQNQDQQNQDQQKQDEQKQDEQDNEEQDEQEQDASDKDEKEVLQPGELSEAQVRALMRRVQARQEEKKAQDAQLRDILTPPEKVEKDW